MDLQDALYQPTTPPSTATRIFLFCFEKKRATKNLLLLAFHLLFYTVPYNPLLTSHKTHKSEYRSCATSQTQAHRSLTVIHGAKPASIQSCNPITLKGDLKTCCCPSWLAGQQLSLLLDDVSGKGTSRFSLTWDSHEPSRCCPITQVFNPQSPRWSDSRCHFFIGGLNQNY